MTADLPDSGPLAVLMRTRALRRGSLAGANLAGMDLSRVELRNISLRGADMTGARLVGARLVGVDLTDAKLGGAVWVGAELQLVRFERTELTDADFRGVSLSQSTMVDLVVARANFAGSDWTDVKASGSRFEGASFEGSTLKGVMLTEVSFTTSSFAAVRAATLTLRACSFSECEFLGATLADVSFNTVKIRQNRFTSALLQGLVAKATEFYDNDWSASVLRFSRGISRADEEKVISRGGRFVHPMEVRAVRRVRSSRPVQAGLGLAVATFIGLSITFCLTPAWQPTALLQARLSRLRAQTEGPLACGDLLPIGEVLAERRSGDWPARLRVVDEVAGCEVVAGGVGKATALYERVLLDAADEPADLPAGLEAFARFLLLQQDYTASAAVIDRLKSAVSDPGQRLRALRLSAALLAASGPASDPRSPHEAALADDPWSHLQIATAELILTLPGEKAPFLENTPTELYFLGEWDRADALLAGCPEVTSLNAWHFGAEAVSRLVTAQHPELALLLLEHFRSDSPLEPGAQVERLRTQVDLLVRLGRSADALGLLDTVAVGASPLVALDLTLLRANALLAMGDAAGAEALLVATVVESSWSFETLSTYCWTLAEARIQLDKEPEAVAALEPMLVAAADESAARGVMTRLASFSSRIARPDLVSAMLARIDNPALRASKGSLDMELVRIHLNARAGTLASDDADLERVFASGSAQELNDGLSTLLSALQARGAIEGELDGLVAAAEAVEQPENKMRMALLLAQAASSVGQPERAIALVEKFGLGTAPNPEIRGSASILLLMAKLDRGELDSALAGFAALPTSSGDQGARIGLQVRLIDLLQAAGRWAEALALARQGRENGAGANPDLRREALTSALAVGRQDEYDSELAKIREVFPSCLAERLAVESRMEGGRPAGATDELFAACAAETASFADRLAGAQLLARSGQPKQAVTVLEAVESPALSADDALRLDCELAGALVGAQRSHDALARLDARYAEVDSVDKHAQLTQATLSALATMGQATPVLEAYRRFAEGHPEARNRQLWSFAADILGSLGATGRIPELGGPAIWAEERKTQFTGVEFQMMVDSGDFDGAWRALEVAVDAPTSVDAKVDLVQRASALADRAAGYERLLALVAKLEATTLRPSRLAQRLDLTHARALDGLGEGTAAMSLVASVLAAAPSPQFRSEALDTYGRLLGKNGVPSEVSAAVKRVDRGAGDAAADQSLRARVSEGLVDRGEFASATSLLEEVVGETIDMGTTPGFFDVLTRAYVGGKQFDAALNIPSRFSSSQGICPPWLALAQHWPADDEHAKEVRAGAVAACDPVTTSVDGVLGLSNAISGQDPAAAVALLGRALESPARGPSERDRLSVQRARMLIAAGDRKGAIALLDHVSIETANADLAAEAGIERIRASAPDGPAAVEAATTRCLDRIGNHPWGRRSALSMAAETFRGLGDARRTLVWQQRAVEATSAAGDDRGSAIFQLAVYELQFRKPGPVAQDEAWHRHAVEALGMVSKDAGVRDELLALELAYTVARHADTAAVEAAVRTAAAGSRRPGQLLDSTAARLETVGSPAAGEVRRIRSEDFP